MLEDTTDKKLRHEWLHAAAKMERARNATMVPALWQRSARTADTLRLYLDAPVQRPMIC